MRASSMAVTTVLALAATTALTACSGSGTGSTASAMSSGARSASPSAAAAGPSRTNAAGTNVAGADTAGLHTATTASPGRQSASGASPVDCAASSIAYKLSGVSRPVDHALLTATNQGSVPCFLYGYPALRFSPDQQAVEQVIADSQPQAVVTLAPGQSAYAGIVTESAEGPAHQVNTVTDVSVALQKRSGTFEGSPMRSVAVSGKALSVDSSEAEATYWQQDVNTALSF
jgi:hypothetical protein